MTKAAKAVSESRAGRTQMQTTAQALQFLVSLRRTLAAL
jgi:hypothetical protein